MYLYYRLNTKIRSTMLCLSGFELYSRWVPLTNIIIQKPLFFFVIFDRRNNKASTSIYKIYAALVKNVINYSLVSLFVAFTQVHYVPANRARASLRLLLVAELLL